MATNELKLEAVRLALASVFGRGHETRDHVELAAAVVGEVFTLRGKLAETEQARHEARFYGNQVAAERDHLQSRLNQAEHAGKMLTAERDRAQAESRTRLLQLEDCSKARDHYLSLIDGGAWDQANKAQREARYADDRVRVMTDALKATEAERDALKAQRDAVARLLSDHGCDCECGCDGDGHVCDETPCFPCQVEAAMKVTVR